MLNDLRAALRALARSPGYAAIAIASLAAGIGACAAVFAVLNALLFAPLPYRDADRIVELRATSSPRSDRPADFLPPERMRAWLDRPLRSFEALAARGYVTAVVGGAREPARASGQAVTEDFFKVLGAPARIGRTLLPSDHLPGAEPAIVLAHRIWQERFAADARYPNVEGTALWRETMQEYPPRPEADAVYEGAADRLTPLQRLYRYHEVSPSYFRTLGIAVVRGRGFTEGDHAGAAPVVIVNESAARVWWPGQDPIGRRLKLGRDAPWLTVVGVVEDVHGTHHLARMFVAGLAARAQPPRPALFRPLAQGGDPPPGWRNSGGCLGCEGVVIAARAARERARVAALMRAEIRRLDPQLPVLEAGTLLERQLGDPIARELRFNRRLASAGSVVALLLAMLGIYGVVADVVRRRTREIGIRVALGARPGQVLAGVAREGLLAAGGGALVGLLAVVALRGPVDRFLLHGDYASLGTAVTDAGVLAATAAALLALALLASWAGARRATHVDPVEALRCE